MIREMIGVACLFGETSRDVTAECLVVIAKRRVASGNAVEWYEAAE